MNQYIKHTIEQPIERMLNAPGSTQDTTWYEIRNQIATARNQHGLFDDVHEALLPFYKQYIMADKAFFKDRESGRKAREFMASHLSQEPPYFFHQFNDINLVECAKNWSKYPKMEKHLDMCFSYLLLVLFTHGGCHHLEQIKEELIIRFKKMNEYGDYKELEFYCLLMAFILVSEKEDLSEETKETYYHQIRSNWTFLKYLYSIMLKHIIGMKSMNFANVISSLVRSKTYYDYMHIAYRAILQNKNGLYSDNETDEFSHRPVKDVINDKLIEIANIIKQSPCNEDIIPLCKILFHKKFDEVLQQKCPPTYAEIEHELRNTKGEIATKDQDYKNLVEKMVKIINSSVSIEEIEQAFKGYPLEFALKTFNAINGLLVGNDTWKKYAERVRISIINGSKAEEQEKIDETTIAMSKAMPPTTINNTFLPGSNTFNAGSTMQGDTYNK